MGAAERCHAGDYYYENPAVAEMGGHFFYLDLLESTYSLVETLFDISFEDLLTGRVLLYEFGWVLGTVKSQAERYFITIFDFLSLVICELYLQTE